LSPTKNRGAYMSWYWMVWGLSSIMAPLVGFQLVATVGYYWFWTIMGIILLFALLLHLRSEKIGL
ncbi:MAG: hypothetical protein KJP00_10895, partial [Bacteroidia bacterium]|nr:hypothetical protein [Bacteroidia bacterium]